MTTDKTTAISDSLGRTGKSDRPNGTVIYSSERRQWLLFEWGVNMGRWRLAEPWEIEWENRRMLIPKWVRIINDQPGKASSLG